MIEQALCPVLIGREAELAALEAALLEARRGSGGLALLGGEAGLGKSRLSGRLVERAESLGVVVLQGGCTEAELALPYLPFIEALGNHVAAVGAPKVRELVGAAAADLGALVPELGDPGPIGVSSDALQSKLRLYEAILVLLRAAAGDRGLLLIVEDIHWADASTRELLDYLSRRLRGTRILMLATYRRDEMHRRHPLAPLVQGWRRSGVTIVELEPFAPDEVAAMVAAILVEEGISAEFRDVLHERSEGNPFVLEELLKDAMDRGDLYRTATGWDRRAIGDLHLPTSVRETILQRVERLPPDAVAILRAAAVLGASFSPDLLAPVADRPAEVVDESLAAFVHEQLVEEEPDSGRYRFRHALTREAVYDDIVVPRRAALHGRAADALADRPSTPAVERALHLFAAGRFAEAVPVAMDAAREAASRYGDREAAELYERILPHIADERERGKVLLRLGRALWRAGDPATAEPSLADGIAALARAGDVPGAAHGHLLLGRVLWELSRQDRARHEYETARGLLEPLGPSRDLANAYVRMAGLCTFEFENEPAIELAERAIEIARACGADDTRIWALGFLGLAMVQVGRRSEGFAAMHRSFEEAASAGLAHFATNALYNEIEIRADYFSAREALSLIEEMDRQPLQIPPRFQSTMTRAYVHNLLGDLGQARAAGEAACAITTESGTTTYGAWAERELAITLATLGEIGRATDLLRGLPVPIERQDIVGIGTASLRIRLDAGQMAEAAAVAADAAVALDWPRPLSAGVLDWLGLATEALVAAGRIDEARRIASSMDMVPLEDGGVHTLIARSRVAVAEERYAEAVGELVGGCEFLHAVGYALLEDRARLLLAEALEASGQRDSAVREARRVLDDATPRGAAVIALAARALLTRLGVEVAPATTLSPAASEPEPVTLVAEERLVTVLFVDVRGYTAIAAEAAPASLADRVAAFHRLARAAIEREGGLVDKFAGDAVMATFNVVQPRLDHAEATLRAAMAVIDRAAGGRFSVGAGIAVGPAVVGSLSTGANVSAVGAVTNLAARLQAQAAAGEILLSGEAHRRVREWLAARGTIAERRDLDLKGFDVPVEAWALTGEG